MATLDSFRENTSMPKLSSPDLIALAQRGDIEAIGTLYDVHCRAIFLYFKARLAHQQTSEDLTGEVFRRMLTALPQFHAVGLPFRAWLFRIAHNLLVDHYRQESTHMTVAFEEAENVREQEIDTAFAVEQKLTMEHAYSAFSELEPSQRDVLALRFVSELSLKETALALGKTEDAVKGLQRRGLAALRISLELR